MKIVYVANHDQHHGNDDEGAITHALAALGHDVQRLSEKKGRMADRLRPDLVLFHKWLDLPTLRRLDGKCKRVFWYFDLVQSPGSDPLLAGRDKTRQAWMRKVIPNVDLGFCTDGDWVSQDETGKLVWLTQGADERVVGVSHAARRDIPILFTGISRGGGSKRQSFVAELKERYGERFHHVPSGVHGVELRNLIGRAQIVVAPDYPVTHQYWSNRVYLTLGFGGFLLHPYCERLTGQCQDRKHVVYYYSRNQLFDLIDEATAHPDCCRMIAESGHARTLAAHTYRHRCAELIRRVEALS